MVAVGHVGGKNLGLADIELLLVRRQLVPLLQDILWPWRQLCIFWNCAEPLLVFEDLIAHLVPAFVEQVHLADLVHPLLRRVMRRMRGTGRVFDEDRLARVGLMHPRHPVDSIVGHRCDKVPRPRLLAKERIDLRRVAEKVRLPLVGVAADKAIEVLKSHAGRPLVEGSDLAGGEGRRVVVLAEPGRRVAVIE